MLATLVGETPGTNLFVVTGDQNLRHLPIALRAARYDITAVLCGVALLTLYVLFVRTRWGQHLDDIAEYFQVDTTWGSVFRSASLGVRGMDFDKRTFFPEQVIHHEFDTTTLSNGVEVRRVRLKAPAGRTVPFFGFSGRSSGSTGRTFGSMRSEGQYEREYEREREFEKELTVLPALTGGQR